MSHDTKQAEKIATARQDFLDSLRRTFESPDGITVLRWLHAAAATRKPSFLPGAAGTAYDPILAAVRDGRKAIVLEIEENLALARLGPGTDKPTASAPSRPRRRGTA